MPLSSLAEPEPDGAKGSLPTRGQGPAASRAASLSGAPSSAAARGSEAERRSITGASPSLC
eukprot:681125-Alexandrium_andersonii.AAC.1